MLKMHAKRHYEISPSHFLNWKMLGFLVSTKNCLIWAVKCENLFSESRREFIRSASKIVRELNGHLEFFSRHQVIG